MILSLFQVIYIIILLYNGYPTASRNTTAVDEFIDYLRLSFENKFHQHCDKYKFVKKFIDRLEYTDDRYLTYVYQEPTLKNGGLGDRLGGLVSAVAMSLRFNRTLLIRSYNSLHELFRPFHPTDIHSAAPKYMWTHYSSWTKFNSKYANHDETEYDLYDCIDTTGLKNEHCSMDGSDATTPLILYRSNRAYLCYYDQNKKCKAYYQMKKDLGVHPQDSNLYEVGGCMLRLALWPTDLLWAEIRKFYQSFFDQLPLLQVSAFMERIRQHSALSIDATNISSVADFFQVGLHFRCGDLSYILNGRNKDMCVFDPKTPHDADFMKTGNPHGIAMCARKVVSQLNVNEESKVIAMEDKQFGQSVATFTHNDTNVSGLYDDALNDSIPRLNATGASRRAFNEKTTPKLSDDTMTVAFITSDNPHSAAQMQSLMGSDSPSLNIRTVVAPSGCHMEFDHSKECHFFTVTQWFLLSLSNVLVTQTLPNSAATSSFSRYAGIYSLNPDVFRNGRDCDNVPEDVPMSRQPQSNWFC